MSERKTAILITYPISQAIDEARSLADAAGYQIIKIITQKQITRSRYGIGKGKAEELKQLAADLKPEVVIFDEVLKPSQTYNLASMCKIMILDRERLILEIFERRASTTESRTQVRLAQLRYDMSRARDMVRLARSGEQPGFFGLGKYEADIYLLDIRKRATVLKKKLEKEKTRRELYRASRTRAGLPTVSLAGYTSAGKTTLFNHLAGEGKVTGQGVFTTLSTFTRAVEIGRNRILLNDTVGFISKLPAYMIDAFKSTLEELKFASLILLVLDASEPLDVMEHKFSSSRDVMSEFEVPETRLVYVLNKVDLTTNEDAFDKVEQLGLGDPRRLVTVSAKSGYNIDLLRTIIVDQMFGRPSLPTGEKVASEEENLDT